MGSGTGGQDVCLEAAGCPTRGLEGLIPPACAFEQGVANLLRCAAVDVILDRRYGLAGPGAVRILLDQAMAMDELLVKRVAERGIVVAERTGTIASAGVEGARRIAGGRKFEEALVLVHGHGCRVGRDFGGRKSGHRLHRRVLRPRPR